MITDTPPVAASIVPTEADLPRPAVLSPTIAPPVGSPGKATAANQSLPVRPAVPNCQTCSTGYVWTFDNGAKINETFAAYQKRTGKFPPESIRLACSTGYCGTAARSPTLPTGNCTCGCHAESCSCAHSKNAGKPLATQKVEPGKAASTSNQTYTRRLFRRWR